jgi:ABC-2 type transport system ATP-binding protein
MITTTNLTKRYGRTLAVDHLDLTVLPGHITGFLGPNGAGKSTTMRLILGLEKPDDGTATVNGKPYRELDTPLRQVGALLDANAVEPRRSAAGHLAWLARSNDIDRHRVDDVLGLVGLDDVAGRRIGTYSLGMRQRLGLAAALLGDPAIIMLDEPINGLDPDGIHWLRGFLRGLADEGRTVFMSSHLMSEMAQTADHLLVMGAGRLIADDTTDALLTAGGHAAVKVRASEGQADLADLIARHGGTARPDADGLIVTDLDARSIGELAATHTIPLLELTPRHATLEETFIELTHDVTAHHATADLALTGSPR